MSRTIPADTEFVTDTREHELGPRKYGSLDKWAPGPANHAFKELAKIYCDRFSASNNALADDLGITAQCCSQWKTGSGGRRPQFSALVWLANATNCQIVIDGDAMSVRRRRKRSRT